LSEWYFNKGREEIVKIILHCEPNTPPMTWAEFLKSAPARSIAIDGYVIGRPMFEAKRALMNANHHEEVDRFSTRCTAAQLATQIRTGLFMAFPGEDPIHVFFNDCDEDVCLSIWLLQQQGVLSRNIVNPILNRILFIEDMLDTTAGAYGFPPDMLGLQENNWIFNPYSLARQNGTLSRRDPREFLQVIESVGSRIDKTIVGNGEKLPLDTKYEVISHHGLWIMVKEIGLRARAGMFADGIKAFVSVRPRDDGRTTCSIGRAGVWIPLDIPSLADHFNALEDDPINKWGGGDTIIGSPRATGSRFTPLEIAEIIMKKVG
jgi:hypothetical protein